MPGVKGKSGNWSLKKNFEASCMLHQSAGILIKAQDISVEEAKEIDFFGELQKEKRRVALEVFKKLAPTNVNLGGQKDNPLETKVKVTWMK